MAFAYCNTLESIEMPDTVTELGEQTFMGCSALESITMPENMTELPAYMFQNCSSLQSFSIPDTLTDLGYLAFVGCSSLKELEVSDSHPIYRLQDGVLYNKDLTELYLYPAGKTETAFTVPDGVTVIDDGACFAASFQSLTLPESWPFRRHCPIWRRAVLPGLTFICTMKRRSAGALPRAAAARSVK